MKKTPGPIVSLVNYKQHLGKQDTDITQTLSDNRGGNISKFNLSGMYNW